LLTFTTGMGQAKPFRSITLSTVISSPISNLLKFLVFI
jgi:hypothetical protein